MSASMYDMVCLSQVRCMGISAGSLHQALKPDVRMQLCIEVQFCLILSSSATWIYPFCRLHAMLCLHGRLVRERVLVGCET